MSVGRERVHRHLATGNMLLHDQRRRARRVERDANRLLHLLRGTHEREPTLSLAVRRLDDTGKTDASCGLRRLGRARADLVRRLGHTGLREPLPLTQFRRRERGGLRGDRMPQSQALGHPSSDRHGPVDPGRDQPVNVLGAREPLDSGLVLGRDDRAAVGVPESGRRRVAIDRDHVQLAGPCCRQQALGSVSLSRIPRHHPSFSRYHAMVRARPSSNEVRARHPVNRSIFSVEPM